MAAWDVVLHTWNLSVCDTEAGGSTVPGQPELNEKILCPPNKKPGQHSRGRANEMHVSKKPNKQIVQNSGIFFCRYWRLNSGPDAWLRIGFPLVCTPAPCSGIA